MIITEALCQKSSLDPSVLSNFSPISKLPFLSKILEKVVATQLIAFMNKNDVSVVSAPSIIRRQLWVEASNNLLLAADSGLYSILILLDLSSAFDTVDYNILISRLKHSLGISEVALNWFISYLSNRTFSVRVHFGSPFIHYLHVTPGIYSA